MSKYIDLDQVEFLKVDGNKEFNHGVDCCVNTLLKQERVTAIPLNKVKKAIERIKQLPITDTAIKLVTEVLDKLIESEGNNEKRNNS